MKINLIVFSVLLTVAVLINSQSILLTLDNQIKTSSMIPKTRVFTFSHTFQASQAQDSEVAGDEHGLRYYHIKTPLTKKDLVMFRYDLEGYGFGAVIPIDITWCGYNYDNGSIIQQVNLNRNLGQTRIKISQYYQDENLVLKFGPVDRYRNAFTLYYQGHYAEMSNLTIGLDQDLYNITATATPANLT